MIQDLYLLIYFSAQDEKCEKAKAKLDSEKCQGKPNNKEVPGAGNEDQPTNINTK